MLRHENQKYNGDPQIRSQNVPVLNVYYCYYDYYYYYLNFVYYYRNRIEATSTTITCIFWHLIICSHPSSMMLSPTSAPQTNELLFACCTHRSLASSSRHSFCMHPGRMSTLQTSCKSCVEACSCATLPQFL